MKKVFYLGLIFLFAGLLTACTPTSKPIYTVTIGNQSSHSICSVKFYPSSSYHLWTKNQLNKSLFKTEKILPYQTTVVNVPMGVYDIRIKTCDGLVWGRDAFTVPKTTFWSVTNSQLVKPVY